MFTVYLATKMTGVDKAKLVREARKNRQIFANYGIDVYSPVLEEGVVEEKGLLTSNRKSLRRNWRVDKAAMRNCFAIVDTTADLKSEGVQHETGFFRYCLWRPVVRISQNGYFSIANLEDDFVVGSIDEAAALLKCHFNTFPARVLWQWKIAFSCLPRYIFDHLRGFFL